MNIPTLKKLLHQDRLERAIKRATYLIRITLFVCISISILFVITIIASGGNFDYPPTSFLKTIPIIIIYFGFYSLLYGTIPVIFIMIIIGLFYRYRKQTASQLLKTELRLLIINIIVVLIAATILAIQYFKQTSIYQPG
jgi:hypothetical protein